MKVRNMMVKIGLVLSSSIFIWKLVLYYNGMYSGDEYNPTIHFVTGLSITILSFVLVNTACRIDNISWEHIGMSSLYTNIKSFLVGTIIWIFLQLLVLLFAYYLAGLK